MSRTKVDWEQNVLREVPNATVAANGVTANCECGAALEVKFARNRLPPVAIRQKVINHGWRIGRKSAICTRCQTKEPEMPEVTAIPLPSTAQTPDARKVHRAVMGWLEQAYDETKNCYTQGFSDKQIADETGAAVEYVAKCREDYFGPIAVPSDLARLREELTRVEQMIRDEGESHEADLQKLREAHTKALDSLRTRFSVIEERLRDMIKKNGWAE